MKMLQSGVTFRDKCRGCNNTHLVKVLDLGEMPLAGGFISPENFISEIKIPLELYVCENCKLAQICHIVDPEILFKNYFYISSVIKSLSEHFHEYSIFLEKNYLNAPGSRLLEMGCNDGVLLQYFQGNKNISTLGIDPSSNVSRMAQDKGLDVINDFFNVTSAKEILVKHGKFDVLTGSNMFAHIDDIIEIIESAKIILKDNGVFIFEVHYLYDLLKDFQYDTIYHEHLTYYSVIAIKKIFELQKMKVIDVIHLAMHGGGIRVVTTMEDAVHSIHDSVEEFIQKEKEYGMEDMELYKKMGDEIVLHKEKLTHMLMDIKNSGKSIVGYGAPGRGTILLNYCNINTDILDYIVDVSPLRKGMYMPGVHVPIVDPSVSHNNPPDYFLVLAWNYIDSILSQEKILHDKGVKFIVPFPTIHIR